MSETAERQFQFWCSGEFFDDHETRGLVMNSGESSEYVVCWDKTKTVVKVKLSLSDVLELLNDAEYYATWEGEADPWLRTLARKAASVANTVRKMLIQEGITPPPPSYGFRPKG